MLPLNHEEMLVACALLDPRRAVMDSGHLVSASDFKDPLLGLIWRVACEVVDTGSDLNLLALFERAGEENIARIIRLNEAVATAHGTPASAKRVRGEAIRRSALAMAERHRKLIESADPADVHDVLIRCQDEMATGFSEDENYLPVSGEQSLKSVAKRVRERYDNRAPVPYLACGLERVDRLTRGWKAGHCYAFGADTGHGKTIFGTWAAAYAAEVEGARTLYVSLEVQIGRAHV